VSLRHAVHQGELHASPSGLAQTLSSARCRCLVLLNFTAPGRHIRHSPTLRCRSNQASTSSNRANNFAATVRREPKHWQKLATHTDAIMNSNSLCMHVIAREYD
jgi:hypothetical protein